MLLRDPSPKTTIHHARPQAHTEHLLLSCRQPSPAASACCHHFIRQTPNRPALPPTTKPTHSLVAIRLLGSQPLIPHASTEDDPPKEEREEGNSVLFDGLRCLRNRYMPPHSPICIASLEFKAPSLIHLLLHRQRLADESVTARLHLMSTSRPSANIPTLYRQNDLCQHPLRKERPKPQGLG